MSASSVDRLGAAIIRGLNSRVIDPDTTDAELLARFPSGRVIAEALAEVVQDAVAETVGEAVREALVDHERSSLHDDTAGDYL